MTEFRWIPIVQLGIFTFQRGKRLLATLRLIEVIKHEQSRSIKLKILIPIIVKLLKTNEM